jgi:hypothetical protein
MAQSVFKDKIIIIQFLIIILISDFKLLSYDYEDFRFDLKFYKKILINKTY